jgi:hypothetical protein
MLAFQPVLLLRAALVAGVGAVLGLLALANLSFPPSPSAQAVQEPRPRAPILVPVAYSFGVVSRVDSLLR